MSKRAGLNRGSDQRFLYFSLTFITIHPLQSIEKQIFVIDFANFADLN